jgi:hypothetical protein
MFRDLAAVFKPQKLPLPVIAVQTRGRRSALGWFAEDQWQVKGCGSESATYDEITICAEHLRAEPTDIAETLLHEMVHLSNALRGRRDCSTNNYHTKVFWWRCAEVGLECRKEGHRGWAKTSLSPELRARVEAVNIDPAAFSIFRIDPEAERDIDTGEDTIAARSRRARPCLTKWDCPGGHAPVWAATGRELLVLCLRCNQPLLRLSPSGAGTQERTEEGRESC